MISFYLSQLSPHTKKLCGIEENMSLRNVLSLMYTSLYHIDPTDPIFKEVRIDFIYLCDVDRDSICIDSPLPTRSQIYSLINVHSNFSAYGLTFYHFSNDRLINTTPYVNELENNSVLEDELAFIQTFKSMRRIPNMVETDTYIRYSNNHTEFYYNRKLNMIHRRIKRDSSYHAFYFKESQNVKYRFRNKNLNLLHFYGVFPDFHLFSKKVAECNSKFRASIDLDPRNFRLRSNPVWRDLNYTFRGTEPLPKNIYGQLKRRHGKISSKELRDFFFGTHYKSLQRILTNFTIRGITAFKSKFAPLCLKYNITVDQQSRYLQNPSFQSYDNHCISALEDIDNLLSKGYSFNRILNYTESVDSYRGCRNFIDSLIMLRRENIWEDANCNLNDNIETIHNKLIIAINRIRDIAYSRSIILTDYEKSLNTVIDGYQFKVADMTDDLALLGDKLRICVRSYDERAVNKSVTIVGVYRDSIPIACLELRPPSTNESRSYTINQAKLERNAYVKNDECLLPIVLSWVEMNCINIVTRDLVDPPAIEYTPQVELADGLLAMLN